MDKRILDELVKYGLVTNINIDPEKYKDVDDLINKGVITIPGAKARINEIIASLELEVEIPTNTLDEPTTVTELETNDDNTNESTSVETENEVREEQIQESEVENAINEDVSGESRESETDITVVETVEVVESEKPKRLKKSTKKDE